MKIILLDTEGKDSFAKDAHHDAKIHSLVCILSSIFIMNSKHMLDSRTLNDLTAVSHISKKMGGKFKTISPKLLWLLRDFQLELVNEKGRTITENQYLEDFLNEEVKSNEGLNKVKKEIAYFFSDRELVTLSHPGSVENLGESKFEDLNENFREGFYLLTDKIGKSLKAKQWNSKNINCKMLAHLINECVPYINGGNILKIESVWETIIKKEDQSSWKIIMDMSKK